MSRRNRKNKALRKRDKAFKKRLSTGVEQLFAFVQEHPKDINLLRQGFGERDQSEYRIYSDMVNNWYKLRRPVYFIQDDVVDEFVTMATKLDTINFSNLAAKNFPSTFVLDLSQSYCLFMSEDKIDGIVSGEVTVTEGGLPEIPGLKHLLGINSVGVQFIQRDVETGDFVLSDPRNANALIVYCMYYGDPNTATVGFENEGGGFSPNCIDCFVVWTAEEDLARTDFQIQTFEEYSLPKIDAICKKNNISLEDRENQSKNFLKAVGEGFGIDFDFLCTNLMLHQEGLPFLPSEYIRQSGIDFKVDPIIKEQMEEGSLGFVQKLLKTIMVNDKTWRMVEGDDGLLVTQKLAMTLQATRQTLVSNIVTSFIKSMSNTETLLEESKKTSYRLSTRKKERQQPRTYSYISVDPSKLAIIRRKRKGAIRQTAKYQSEVENYKQFKWVKESNLWVDEEIFDLKEGVTEILYKVRRTQSGYTKNKHLPKRKVLPPSEQRAKLKVVRKDSSA